MNRMHLNVPPQLYYQNGIGNLNEYGLNNESYMYGDDLINHQRFQNQQVPHGWYGDEFSHNPYLHHQDGIGGPMNGNPNWGLNPNRDDEYQSGFNKIKQPHYFGYDNYQDNSNIIGNPLIHEEVSYKQQGHTNQFSSEPFSGFMSEKSVKKQGAFKSVMDQFKSDNGSIDFNKMVGTTSQLASAINQVSGFVKGVSGIFKVGA